MQQDTSRVPPRVCRECRSLTGEYYSLSSLLAEYITLHLCFAIAETSEPELEKNKEIVKNKKAGPNKRQSAKQKGPRNAQPIWAVLSITQSACVCLSDRSPDFRSECTGKRSVLDYVRFLSCLCQHLPLSLSLSLPPNCMLMNTRLFTEM